MTLALQESRDPPAVRCRCRVRLDLRGPTPAHSFRTAGGTTLTVGPALPVLPDPATALALFEAAGRAARIALPRLPPGTQLPDPVRWPMHAAVLLYPETISYRVFGGSVSFTRSPVVVFALGRCGCAAITRRPSGTCSPAAPAPTTPPMSD